MAADKSTYENSKRRVEEWGRGTIKMADLAISAGLPHPEIEERGDCVTVRFRRADYVHSRQVEIGLTELQNTLLQLLRQSDRALALREIRMLIESRPSERRLREDLAILKSKGLSESTGHGRGARWKSL